MGLGSVGRGGRWKRWSGCWSESESVSVVWIQQQIDEVLDDRSQVEVVVMIELLLLLLLE
jgi:hypothetical protein